MRTRRGYWYINKAMSQMGDYKLKTSSDYVDSDQKRMSTDNKRRELLICRNNVSVYWRGGLKEGER